MAKDNDISKDLGEGEDEDLLDFDFGEDLLGEEREVKGEESDQEEKEALEDVLPEKSELREKVFESAAWEVVSQYPSGQEEEASEKTVLMEKMEEAAGEEPEPSIDLEEEINLDEGLEELEELVSEEDKEALEDVLPEKSEVKEKLFESAAWEVVSQYPSGQEEAGEETVPMKEMEEAVKKETLPISKEKIEALLGKVVSDILEKVAREVIPEVTEKIIREEIDVLKKQI